MCYELLTGSFKKKLLNPKWGGSREGYSHFEKMAKKHWRNGAGLGVKKV